MIAVIVLNSCVYTHLNSSIYENRKQLDYYIENTTSPEDETFADNYYDSLKKEINSLETKIALLEDNDEAYIRKTVEQYIEAVYNYTGYRRDNKDAILEKVKPIVTNIHYSSLENSLNGGVGNGGAKEEKREKKDFCEISTLALSDPNYSERLNMTSATAIVKITSNTRDIYLKILVERYDRENTDWQISYVEQLYFEDK